MLINRVSCCQLPQIAFGTGSVMKRKVLHIFCTCDSEIHVSCAVPEDATDVVEQALENGFWHIDTAASECSRNRFLVSV